MLGTKRPRQDESDSAEPGPKRRAVSSGVGFPPEPAPPTTQNESSYVLDMTMTPPEGGCKVKITSGLGALNAMLLSGSRELTVVTLIFKCNGAFEFRAREDSGAASYLSRLSESHTILVTPIERDVCAAVRMKELYQAISTCSGTITLHYVDGSITVNDHMQLTKTISRQQIIPCLEEAYVVNEDDFAQQQYSGERVTLVVQTNVMHAIFNSVKSMRTQRFVITVEVADALYKGSTRAVGYFTTFRIKDEEGHSKVIASIVSKTTQTAGGGIVVNVSDGDSGDDESCSNLDRGNTVVSPTFSLPYFKGLFDVTQSTDLVYLTLSSDDGPLLMHTQMGENTTQALLGTKIVDNM